MPTIRRNEELKVDGTLNAEGAVSVRFNDNSQNRSIIKQRLLQPFPIQLENGRVWDDVSSLLPSSAAADDLALITGTFGTDAPTVQSSDAKATTVAQKVRYKHVLTEPWEDGETVQLVVTAGMVTTISDDTATLDAEVYAHDGTGAVGSDLCATSAQSINSLTKADYTFAITSTGLVVGDVLDIVLTIDITDAATGTAVIGEVSHAELRLDTR